MQYIWLLFDADDTLFDYGKAEAQALQATFEQFNHPYAVSHLDVYRPINHQLWVELERGTVLPAELQVLRFERLFEALGLKGDAAAFGKGYLQNLAGAWALVEGAQETVKTLHQTYRLVVITNGLKNVQRPRLNASPIGQYFDDVIISEEIGFAKPSCEFFDVAFERMGHPDKAQVLLIGDSLSADIRGGVAYGIDTCWFNPHHLPRPEDLDIRYEISALPQLIELLSPAAEPPAHFPPPAPHQ